MNLSRRDGVLLDKMLSEIADIETFTAGLTGEVFASTKVVQKAVTMTLINIGELAKNFSEDFLGAMDSIPWRDIRGLRNLAAHHYDAVDMGDIWLTIEKDIPELKAVLQTQRAANGTTTE